MQTPSFSCQNQHINRAFRIALGDFQTNICTYQAEFLPPGQNVLLAGLDYGDPWTRDAAINVWNGAGLLYPDVAKNTLLSVLKTRDGQRVIGGEYWDAIIWACGAWAYYAFTGDREFLGLAYSTIHDTILIFEREEFNPQTGLFRGAACYGDGIAAYPDRYADTGGSSHILAWVRRHPELAAPTGAGLPMQALSTNCLYYQAYRLLNRMENELGIPLDPQWQEKAERLKDSIQTHFWSPDLGRYRYLVDPFGGCDRQEGLGHAFALLFDLPSPDQKESIFKNVIVTPYGIACLYPGYERYRVDEQSYGRHSGTVWPHVQGFWAHAAAMNHRTGAFAHELFHLAELADRDCQFAEIYHPDSGQIYGGLQEGQVGEWHSCVRQTWSATAFLRMICMGLLGMDFEPDGIRFHPVIPAGLGEIHLLNLPYRRMNLHIHLYGSGIAIQEFKVNGIRTTFPVLPSGGSGDQQIRIEMAE